MESPYVYQPLSSSRSTRVIILHPSNDTTSFLRASLKEISLDDTDQQYKALSYFWGDRTGTLPIYFGDKVILITPNCDSALKQIRNEKDDVIIWVDAICINQQDPQEKGVQVPMMSDIYGGAKEVLIWLGQQNNPVEQSFSRLKDVGRRAFEAGLLDLDAKDIEDAETLNPVKRRIISDVRPLLKELSQGRDFPVDLLPGLTQQKWFYRVWIIQEFYLAKECTVLQGADSILKDHLFAALCLFIHWEAVAAAELDRDWASCGDDIAEFVERMRQAHPYAMSRLEGVPRPIDNRAIATLGLRDITIGEMNLFEHLRRAFVVADPGQRMDSSDPKDRIYAFLGISKDREQLCIQPRYEKSISYQDIYTEVASKLLTSGHMDILSLCLTDGDHVSSDTTGNSRDSKLPSWVPDWTKPIKYPWSASAKDRLFTAGHTNIAGGNPSSPATESGEIQLHAILVGTVMSLGSRWCGVVERSPVTGKDQLTLSWDKALALFEEIDGMLNNPRCRYEAEQKEEASWRIPIGDLELDAESMCQVKRATRKIHQEYTVAREYALQRTKQEQITRCSNFCGSLESMYGNYPFMTDTGYVGLCPEKASEGDKVFIPLGAHVPYLFKSLDDPDAFKIIGETYVFGAMDGEWVREGGATDILHVR